MSQPPNYGLFRAWLTVAPHLVDSQPVDEPQVLMVAHFAAQYGAER